MHTHKKCRTINVHLYTLYMHAHVLSVCTCIYMYIHAYSMYMHVVYTDIHSLSLHSTQNLWNTNIYCQLYATERGGGGGEREREWEREWERERERERERKREREKSVKVHVLHGPQTVHNHRSTLQITNCIHMYSDYIRMPVIPGVTWLAAPQSPGAPSKPAHSC